MSRASYLCTYITYPDCEKNDFIIYAVCCAPSCIISTAFSTACIARLSFFFSPQMPPFRAARLLTALALFSCGAHAISQVSRNGRYLYNADGSRFYIKGMAYQTQGMFPCSLWTILLISLLRLRRSQCRQCLWRAHRLPRPTRRPHRLQARYSPSSTALREHHSCLQRQLVPQPR
jgi:hypothetical protein